MTDASFTCECGRTTAWISDGQITGSCPFCGRSYMGKYNNKTYTIDAIELDFPSAIIEFYKNEPKVDGWKVSKKMSGFLPSPLNQFKNKIKNKKNDMTYTVSFEFKRED